MMMTPWEHKAHCIVAKHSRAAWLANKKRAGYRIPEIASALVAVLGWKDRRAAEVEAKRLFHIDAYGAWSLV